MVFRYVLLRERLRIPCKIRYESPVFLEMLTSSRDELQPSQVADDRKNY